MAENHHSKSRSGGERPRTPLTSRSAHEEPIVPVTTRLNEAVSVSLPSSPSAATRAGMDAGESTQHASDCERQTESVRQLQATLTSDAPTDDQDCASVSSSVSRSSAGVVAERAESFYNAIQEGETSGSHARHDSVRSTSTVVSNTGTDNASNTTAETTVENDDVDMNYTFDLDDGSQRISEEDAQLLTKGWPKD